MSTIIYNLLFFTNTCVRTYNSYLLRFTLKVDITRTVRQFLCQQQRTGRIRLRIRPLSFHLYLWGDPPLLGHYSLAHPRLQSHSHLRIKRINLIHIARRFHWRFVCGCDKTRRGEHCFFVSGFLWLDLGGVEGVFDQFTVIICLALALLSFWFAC